jgi:hypothetical protein
VRGCAFLCELLVEEYEGTGLHRKLSPLDVQVGVILSVGLLVTVVLCYADLMASD